MAAHHLALSCGTDSRHYRGLRRADPRRPVLGLQMIFTCAERYPRCEVPFFARSCRAEHNDSLANGHAKSIDPLSAGNLMHGVGHTWPVTAPANSRSSDSKEGLAKRALPSAQDDNAER